MANRVFIKAESSWVKRQIIPLSKEHSHHLLRVLRLRPNESIELVNLFDQQVFKANLNIQEGLASAEIIECLPITKSTTQITLIFAICKGDKNELILEKCTELGVDRFIILQAERSIPRFDQKKLERLEKIVESAASQSKRHQLPTVELIKKISELKNILDQSKPNNRLIASLQKDKLIRKDQIQSAQETILAVGPEGDFTDLEYNLFADLGFQPLSLGETILRSETACIAAVAGIKMLLS